jgi:hypothetical protein
VIGLDDERSDGEESKISSFFWNDPGSDDGDDGDRGAQLNRSVFDRS